MNPEKGFADAACAPIDFPTAPTLAVPLALKNAGVTKDEIALWEFNEAFSVVGVAAERVLGLDRSKVNIKGGAVALGHVRRLLFFFLAGEKFLELTRKKKTRSLSVLLVPELSSPWCTL